MSALLHHTDSARSEGNATAKAPSDGFTVSDLSAYFGTTAAAASRTPTRSDLPATSINSMDRLQTSHKLSPGAIAGIVIGVLVGTIILGAAVVWLLTKKKKRTRDQALIPEGTSYEIEEQDHVFSKRKWFLKGRWWNEVEETVDPQELDSKTVHIVPGPPVELEASYLRHEEVMDSRM